MAPLKGKPVSRRTLMKTGGAFVGALGTLALMEELAIVPERLAWADEAVAFPDVQFDLAPFMPPAQTIDGVAMAFPPVHTTFLTARLAAAPSKADQTRMENALLTIEANYPYSPAGVFTHVSYSVDYFNRIPSSIVSAAMPLSIAFGSLPANQPALKRAVVGPSDVASGNHVFALRRQEFNVPVRLENNDILFTIRSDNPSFVADVVRWLSGSNSLRGQAIASPRFDAGMSITSSRAMFVQPGLPRNIASRNGLSFASFVNPFSAMWMGFEPRHQADQLSGRPLLRQRLHPAPVARAARPASVLCGRYAAGKPGRRRPGAVR